MEALEQLRACTKHGEENIDSPVAFLKADMQFHQLIVESTNNPFLERVSQSISTLGKASREFTVQLPGVRQQSHADHEDILDALTKRDPDQAGRAMQRHLENVWHAYQQHTRTESNR
jgi:GntR family transcriptional regulator, transcriptional repressor for pyruvate dehydrogenase complex